MFTLWGSKQPFCDGISRRNFLKIGAFGAGLTLADMLRMRSLAATSAAAQPITCTHNRRARATGRV